MSFVKTEVENKVARVTLCRAPANAMTHDMYVDIAVAMEELGERKDVAVIILRAEGKIFCGGNDTSAFSSFNSRSGAEAAARDAALTCGAIWGCKKPVICAVQGAAMGIGFAMALVSDFIIGGEGVKFGMPEINLGIPAAGCFLAATLPLHKAKELAFLGKNIVSEELKEWGVVMDVVPKDEVWAAADKLAERIATQCCYRAMGIFKQNFNRNVDADFGDKFMVEQHSFMDHMLFSHDFKEAIAAYSEKRAPQYTGE